MKKLLLLLLLYPAITYSQDTVKIPMPVAKQIVRDLIDYDQTKTVLRLTQESLKLTEGKVVAKDSIIRVFGLKEVNYLQQIDAEKSKTVLWQQQYESMKSKYKKEKFIKNLQKIGSMALIGSLGYLYIVK